MQVITALRSLIFSIGFLGLTIVFAFVGIVLAWSPRRWLVGAQRIWSLGIMALLKYVNGIRYQVSGLEHLPEGPFILASKHQSTWETIALNLILDDPAYVLKQELTKIPIYGWYARKSGNIAIDRGGGSTALRAMLREADAAVADGRPIVIFPEGTRAEPGAKHPYHPGVAGLYRHLKLPVVPAALTSGLHWGRRRFLKNPGVIRMEFLPAIPPGLSKDVFLAELEERIEAETERLLVQAKT